MTREEAEKLRVEMWFAAAKILDKYAINLGTYSSPVAASRPRLPTWYRKWWGMDIDDYLGPPEKAPGDAGEGSLGGSCPLPAEGAK